MESLHIFELKAKFAEITEWLAETPTFLKISIKTYRAHLLNVSMHFFERFCRKCPLFQSLGCSLVAISGKWGWIENETKNIYTHRNLILNYAVTVPKGT